MTESTVSSARLAANRANAQHSTGPRTPEGKARSSQNGLKHGLFSASLNWSGGPLHEKSGERDGLRAGLFERYAPDGIDEELIVDEMATLWWRLVRLNAHAQWRLRNRVKAGADLMAAVKESESLGVEEARAQRALTRARKDLLFLQRYRQGETRAQRAAASARLQALAAQAKAETDAFLRDTEAELERAREQDAAEEASLRGAPIAAETEAAPELADGPQAAPAAASEVVDGAEVVPGTAAAELAPQPAAPEAESARRSAA